MEYAVSQRTAIREAMQKHTVKRQALFVVLAMLGSRAACAQTGSNSFDGFVDRADANGDGVVSLHELRAAHYADPEFNRRIEQSFRRFDRDGDGVISAQERGLLSRPSGAVTPAAPAAVAPEAPPAQQAPTAARSFPRDEAARPPRNNSTAQALTLDASPLGSAPAASSTPPEQELDAPRQAVTVSRTQAWILEIDTDRSGTASASELLASGDGQRWFSSEEFNAADRDKDDALNAEELDALVRSLERRQRR